MRLIDADELIKRMDALKWKVASDTTNLEMIGIKFANEMNNNLQVIASNMPTAYDIDKVVEELEELAKQEDTPKYLGDVEFDLLVGVSDVIKIVKSGCTDK